MDLFVDLPAVRPGRLARAVAEGPLADEARELRHYVRGARAEDLADGIRLAFDAEPHELAALADLIRRLADRWPFLSFRLAAAPPRCHLEVRGDGAAAGVARAVFRELRA